MAPAPAESMDSQTGGGGDKYAAILSLDEEGVEESEAELWSERNAIITKIDHERNERHARDIVEEMVGNVRTPVKSAAARKGDRKDG